MKQTDSLGRASRVLTRPEILARVRAELNLGNDPRLTITEVATVVDFHRRTLQRYVDEGLINHEIVGPKRRFFIRWSSVRRSFPESTVLSGKTRQV